MKYKVLYIFLISLVFVSCEFPIKMKQEETGNPVAKVYEKILYEHDLEDVFPDKISKEDSVLFLKSYIDSWAKKQLLLHQSELNLENDKASFDKLVEDYRSTLFINAYKEALVSSKLDTTVSKSQIEKYYLANNNNFKLNEELVQLKYLHTSSERPDKKGLIKLFKSTKEEDIDSLQLRALEFKSYNFNDTMWIKFSDLLKQMPTLKNEKKNNVLKKFNFIQKEDSLGLYLIRINNVLKSNDIAPMSYVKPTIKQIILHKRKLELLRKTEEDLLNDAIKNQNFEKY